ncbi:hypothetical protein ACTXL1_10385 [Psychrobacter celer]|uniref:hypothetical protein n=1 Tax=Psychrobacter celer TaxID=306572 RepID=UPI003FD58800
MREIREFKYDLDGTNECKTNIAILGPSHVHDWRVNISNKNLPEVPFLLYGYPGASIYGPAFENFLDWWVIKLKRKAILLVPDFRVGNPYLAIDKDYEACFIDKNLMSNTNDLELKTKSWKVLKYFTTRYGKNIKLIFWSLYCREKINIKNEKYIDKYGNYNHPLWNYSEYAKEFSENLIDIDFLGNKVLDYIDPNAPVHPNKNGYLFLANLIDDYSENK